MEPRIITKEELAEAEGMTFRSDLAILLYYTVRRMMRMVDLLLMNLDDIRTTRLHYSKSLGDEIFGMTKGLREALKEYQGKPSITVTCPRCNLVIYGEEKP